METKISVVVTVKNDEAGIAGLRKALEHQTIKPDEVIVIRAEEHGNCSRGKGRNVGIRMSRNEVIAVTDAGCRPHPDWLEKLTASFQLRSDLPRSDLERSDLGKLAVAGGYRAVAKTDLQRMMSHFLVPEEFYEETPRHPSRSLLPASRSTGFLPSRSLLPASRSILPASRSIMFTKKAWESVGGYPEEAVSGGEDLEFARRLAAHPDVKMIYCPEAVVDWEPPATLREFFRDIVKHTRGNVEVGYWPHLIKNFTVVLRWTVFLAFPWMIPIYLVLVMGKGIKIIKVIKIINIVQIIIVQLAADGGVIWGIILGILGRLGRLGKLGRLGRLGNK